jgi:hypothetical protein
VADSKAWVHIDAMWPKFATKPHNVQLALAIDEVNPFSEKSNSWSSWLVLLFKYNLPPWLVTKTFFVMLGLDIPSPKFVRMHNINVYMAPLIEELQELWRGVIAWGVRRLKCKGSFIYE